ncbi:MAG: hypothetical protein COT90_02010 [Candidatus Diapherotrites archaeon CG10_big_fil_rev_8_21_14_0_10_31_34]|nr:MAG: hypothetical protein COT90_02010 [Candidatus Diapherotrites archaeon CG10_big_fil_rev_8_21_14_0_10_31_34]PJA19294.1 MAG: hypothetical protein COX63_01640 [Candidatus Diapherotrites archaeon CG_4_10_14_0_2_um_filter_31_5]
MEGKCNCSNKCYCKGGALIIVGVLGFLAYFNVWTLPYLTVIWPIIAVITGIMVAMGICCCSMPKK